MQESDTFLVLLASVEWCWFPHRLSQQKVRQPDLDPHPMSGLFLQWLGCPNWEGLRSEVTLQVVIFAEFPEAGQCRSAGPNQWGERQRLLPVFPREVWVQSH